MGYLLPVVRNRTGSLTPFGELVMGSQAFVALQVLVAAVEAVAAAELGLIGLADRRHGLGEDFVVRMLAGQLVWYGLARHPVVVSAAVPLAGMWI